MARFASHKNRLHSIWLVDWKEVQGKTGYFYQRMLVNTQTRNDNLLEDIDHTLNLTNLTRQQIWRLQYRYLRLRPKFRNHSETNNSWDQKAGVVAERRREAWP